MCAVSRALARVRLVHEARALAAHRGVACQVSHALDFGVGRERDPLRRLADSLLGLMPDSALDVRLAAVESFIAAEPIEARLQPFLRELAEASLTLAMRGLIDASDEDSCRATWKTGPLTTWKTDPPLLERRR